LVSPSGEERPVRILARAGAGKRVLARISGVATPEDAAALHGWHVDIDRAALPPPEPGEHYIHDLVDLPVQDEAGTVLGTLVDVVTGEHDIWVVGTPTGEAYLVASRENLLAVEPDRIVVRA